MSFGGWSIDEDLFDFIKTILPPDKTILELGSGNATEDLVKHWHIVYSIEHNEEWVGKFHDNYIYAPLKPHKELQNHEGMVWYDARILEVELPVIDYDLILVDGPPGGRAGFVKYLNIFKANVPIVFDDANLKRTWRVMRSVSARLQRPYEVHNTWNDGKDFGVIR